jgi:hypothetical protein
VTCGNGIFLLARPSGLHWSGGSRRIHPGRRWVVVAGGIVALVAAGCLPPAPKPAATVAPPAPPAPVTVPLPTSLEVSTSPVLFPAFDPTVSDYVVRCDANPVSVTIGAPAGTTVSVAGQPAMGGRFTESTTGPSSVEPLEVSVTRSTP